MPRLRVPPCCRKIAAAEHRRQLAVLPEVADMRRRISHYGRGGAWDHGLDHCRVSLFAVTRMRLRDNERSCRAVRRWL